MILNDGGMTIFDCLEFNADLRWTDVMSEVARRALVALVTAEALESAAALGPTALLGAQGGAADAGAANASLRGAWHYRVGLVGKPSAGKPPRAERLQPFRCRPARPRLRAPSVA